MKGDREEEFYVKNRGKRLRWPAAARSQQSVKNVKDMLLLDEIMPDEFGLQHV